MAVAHTVAHALKTHGILSIAGFIGLVAIVSTAQQALDASLLQQAGTSIDIAIEHTKPGTLSFEASSLHGHGILTFENTADEEVFISVPSSYTRRSVKNAKLTDVQATDAMLGFTRWSLPSLASVSFEGTPNPEHVLVHNPSKQPLHISFTYIDLDADSSVYDSTIIKDMSVELW